jgi:plastocyanin
MPAGLALAAPQTHTIVIEGMQFNPAALEVRMGDTIIWHNKDIVPHTVTSAKQQLNSGEIGASRTWTYRPNDVGTISYICTYHPTMKGRLTIKK